MLNLKMGQYIKLFEKVEGSKTPILHFGKLHYDSHTYIDEI